MTENTGFAAFALYHSLKLHFTSNSYDYHKYNGKTNVSKDSFLKRKDKYSFYRLSRKYDLPELKDFLVANFVTYNVNWIGEIMGAEAEDAYTKWQKRIQSLTYNFNNDMDKVMESGNPEQHLKVVDGQYPKLYDMLGHEKITLESFVILNDILNFFPMWNKKIDDDIIWPSFRLKCEKYAPFIEYDKAKFKSILRDKMQEYA
jgi:hypothetical protein